MSRTKVIEYIGSLGDGGAETLVKDYTRLIDRNNFEIVVVVTRDFGHSANKSQIENAGIRVIYVYPHWNIAVRIWNKLAGLWYIPFRMRKIILKEKADVLHTHLALLKYVRRVGKALDGVRLFFTCHNVVSTIFGGKNCAERKAAEYLIKNNGLQIVALHQEMAEELNEMFGIDNTVVIRNGIDFSRFENSGVTKEEERNELEIPQDAFVVGHVGRFNPVKNHMYLAEVFKEVALLKPNAFMLMVGAGDSSDTEKKLAEYGLGGRYMILSHRSDVNRILKAMDVFVFPSIYEGLPLSLIEAQVSGLKCVVSDAVSEEAFKTEKAIALPLGDAKCWADVILDDEVRSEAKGSLDEYDMNKEIKRLEKLYQGEWDE